MLQETIVATAALAISLSSIFAARKPGSVQPCTAPVIAGFNPSVQGDPRAYRDERSSRLDPSRNSHRFNGYPLILLLGQDVGLVGWYLLVKCGEE